MSQLTPKKPRTPRAAPAPGAVMPKNLVTEIVDQITEKQARAIRRAEAAAGSPEKAWHAEEPVAGTPYQTVLSCASEDSETP
jgi:hypothetical protein